VLAGNRVLFRATCFGPTRVMSFGPTPPTGSQEGKPAPSWTFPRPAGLEVTPDGAETGCSGGGQINLLKTACRSRWISSSSN
jgi:hypothetical protein